MYTDWIIGFIAVFTYATAFLHEYTPPALILPGAPYSTIASVGTGVFVNSVCRIMKHDKGHQNKEHWSCLAIGTGVGVSVGTTLAWTLPRASS
jgi:hypothetical protein